MFYYIEGVVSLIDGSVAVVDCGGVGYAVNTTVNSLSCVRIGEKVRFYTCTIIREDCFDIYGFISAEEKRSFELLTGVSGVGVIVCNQNGAPVIGISVAGLSIDFNEEILCEYGSILKQIAKQLQPLTELSGTSYLSYNPG